MNVGSFFMKIIDFLTKGCYTNHKERGEYMVSVFDVAKWFLSKQSMTHKKVQKLCYYSQAWHCALYGTPLFADEIQAWVHGPVVPALYPIYADYKWLDIPQEDYNGGKLEEKTINILEAVYTTYAEFSGDQLESLTHTEDPWIIARGNMKPWENCSNAISPESMKVYYRRKYEESQND